MQTDFIRHTYNNVKLLSLIEVQGELFYHIRISLIIKNIN